MAKRLPGRSGYVVPFLVGLAAAPFVKPLLRGAIKSAVGASLQMRVLAAEATQELKSMAAQVTAEAGGTGPAAPMPPPG